MCTGACTLGLIKIRPKKVNNSGQRHYMYINWDYKKKKEKTQLKLFEFQYQEIFISVNVLDINISR